MSAATFFSQIVPARVHHARLLPRRHEFSYRTLFWMFELDEAEHLSSWWFGWNCWRLFSVFTKDYLAWGERSLREKVLERLSDPSKIRKIFFLTSPRLLGYAFNPASFYICYDQSEEISAFIVEINNTFYEKHVYVLEGDDLRRRIREGHEDSSSYHAAREKAFYVSPFFDLNFLYDFSLSDVRHKLDIRINLRRDGHIHFMSRLCGCGKSLPFSSRSLPRILLQYGLVSLLTYPRIVWQAMQLWALKKVPVVDKPNPSSPHTVRAEPLWLLERACKWIARRKLRRARRGSLRLRLPDGREESFGLPAGIPEACVHVRNYRVFSRAVRHGGVGFGDSYVDGDWESPDLTAVIKFFLNNYRFVGEAKSAWFKPLRALSWISHRLRANSRPGSRRNISFHYDLSNDFFKLFLDPSMTYSCAYFRSVEESLGDAQRNKISKVLDKAVLCRGDSVLEIGSGWGSLAIEAARERGCSVRSITLSKEQLDYATKRARTEGLSGKVNFEYCDYRDVQGTYDKIVSVEMLEAVGHEHLSTFFKTCERVLKPDGLVVLQVITVPDQEYDGYRSRTDWIQRRIFPGSHLPSLKALIEAIHDNSSLIVESVENIGPHYARTLAEWRKNLLAARERVLALGFDERFMRAWDFYFASCEAQFATRWLNVMQIVLTRPNNKALIADADGSRRDILAEPAFIRMAANG